MIIRYFRGGDAREVCIRGEPDGLRACAGISSRWIAARDRQLPNDFDPWFDRPQPCQSSNRGADQNVQDWEEVLVPSWLSNDGFRGMKGDARNRDSLCARGGDFSNSVGNGEANESLTKDKNWIEGFGHL